MSACPHCPDGHDNPAIKPWAVWVAAERDGDGQPVRLIVQPTDCSHVAESDAEWLRRLIHEYGGETATSITPDDPMLSLTRVAKLLRGIASARRPSRSPEYQRRTDALRIAAAACEELEQLRTIKG